MGTSALSRVVVVMSPQDPHTGISDQGDDIPHFVYLNPVKNKFTLVSPGNSEVKFFDAHGNLLFSKNSCSASESFDLTNFSKGIYLLHTRINSKTDVIKVVKY